MIYVSEVQESIVLMYSLKEEETKLCAQHDCNFVRKSMYIKKH